MTADRTPVQPAIAIVAIRDDDYTGEKAVFSRARERMLEVSSVTAETLGESLASLCAYVGQVFSMAEDSTSQLSLDSVEVSVEVTAKGEVRLIGAASAEVKGGLKLHFRKASPV